MLKYFCDICGKDITDYRASRLVGRSGRLTVEVMTAIDGTWNGGHACEDCVKAAVLAGGVDRRMPPPQQTGAK